jgi:hypothetical protein
MKQISQRRGRRLHRELAALCHAGYDLVAVVNHATTVLRSAIPFDRSCWHSIDPATGLLTSAVRDQFEPDPRFPHYEYCVADVNKFAELARRRPCVGVISRATDGTPEHSPRYRDLLKPLGIAHELRAAFVSAENCWGACALYRDDSRPDFTDEEAGLVAGVAPLLAAGLRRALLVAAFTGEMPTGAPGLILLADDDSAVRFRHPPTSCWRASLMSRRAGVVACPRLSTRSLLVPVRRRRTRRM